MAKLFFIHLFILCGFSVFAETFLLKGKIVDQKRNPIEAAYVEVLKENNQVIGYTLSDSIGRFYDRSYL